MLWTIIFSYCILTKIVSLILNIYEVRFKIICISSDLNTGELRKLCKQNKKVVLRNRLE